jgi:hypothetical protein
VAAPTTRLVIIKRFNYRGDAMEEFSNSYMLTGTTPADSAAWRTLFDALVLQEKTIYGNQVTVVRGYGYASVADDATAVWSVDLTVSPNTPVAGTLDTSSGSRGPGDTAVWVRWGLDRLNSRGKRIYLRRYFHGAWQPTGGGDAVFPAQITALNALGAKLQDGTFASGRLVTDKLGSAVIGHGASAYVTTRTLKRRGKRPPT